MDGKQQRKSLFQESYLSRTMLNIKMQGISCHITCIIEKKSSGFCCIFTLAFQVRIALQEQAIVPLWLEPLVEARKRKKATVKIRENLLLRFLSIILKLWSEILQPLYNCYNRNFGILTGMKVACMMLQLVSF